MFDIAQLDGFAREHPQGPVVVARRRIATGNGDEMGLLRARERLVASRSCRLSVSTASTPPLAKRARTCLTVLRQTSKAWQTAASLQPSPSFNKTWARVRVRAAVAAMHDHM